MNIKLNRIKYLFYDIIDFIKNDYVQDNLDFFFKLK